MKLTPIETVSQSRLLHMAVLSNKRIYSSTRKTKPHLLQYMPQGTVLYRVLRLDLTDLYVKYKDFVWASDVQMEKLSLCEMGLQDFNRGPSIVGQGHREIASVALPGVNQPELNAGMEDITYTRVKRKYGVDPDTTYDVTSR